MALVRLSCRIRPCGSHFGGGRCRACSHARSVPFRTKLVQRRARARSRLRRVRCAALCPGGGSDGELESAAEENETADTVERGRACLKLAPASSPGLSDSRARRRRPALPPASREWFT